MVRNLSDGEGEREGKEREGETGIETKLSDRIKLSFHSCSSLLSKAESVSATELEKMGSAYGLLRSHSAQLSSFSRTFTH